MKVKVGSVCSGVGGFELGILNAIPDAEFVFASEIDIHARKVYQNHFGGEHLHGDITKINPANLPDFDLLCGGFPCQAFSLAGKREGFKDSRGRIFFDIARIIQEKRPKTLFLENVKGLLNHNGGKTFGTILYILDELGYDAEWQVLNSKDFGVPQNRERVFIIGHLRGQPFKQVFPISKKDSRIDERNRETKIVRCLSAGGNSGGLHSNMTLITHSLYPRSSTTGEGGTGHLTKNDGTAYCLDCNNMQAIEVRQMNPSTESGGKQPYQQNRVYDSSGLSPALDSKSNQKNVYDGNIRRLTPVECERLQGFPDNWTEGISDTQRFKCIGNAVTVPVIEAIAERLT